MLRASVSSPPSPPEARNRGSREGVDGKEGGGVGERESQDAPSERARERDLVRVCVCVCVCVCLHAFVWPRRFVANVLLMCC